MRVITGTAKGVPLKSIQGNDTRPTSDKVKEAIFSAVQFDVEGAVILDLFAGSGQLGIEALSRGAKMAYFADNNNRSVAVIKENLEKTLLANKSRVDRLPYTAFLRLAKARQVFCKSQSDIWERFDIAFIDPPYNKGIIEKVLPMLLPLMNTNGIIICEHDGQLNLNGLNEQWTVDCYNYGVVNVTILRLIS
jgi:16S rRNA (guanine(966)-N(2))-methyltransferase RsmD